MINYDCESVNSIHLYTGSHIHGYGSVNHPDFGGQSCALVVHSSEKRLEFIDAIIERLQFVNTIGCIVVVYMASNRSNKAIWLQSIPESLNNYVRCPL